MCFWASRDYIVKRLMVQLRVTAPPERNLAPGAAVRLVLPPERCRGAGGVKRVGPPVSGKSAPPLLPDAPARCEYASYGGATVHSASTSRPWSVSLYGVAVWPRFAHQAFRLRYALMEACGTSERIAHVRNPCVSSVVSNEGV
jgi:hypothetical protein